MRLQANAFDALDHFADNANVARSFGDRQAAEASCTSLLGCARCSLHLFRIHQPRGFDLRFITRALGTIAAVLQTPARLNRQQRRELDSIRVMIGAMELLGMENQIRQRGAEGRSDLLSRPIVSHIGVRGLRHFCQ